MKAAPALALLLTLGWVSASAQPRDGAALFEDRCSGCHVAGGGGQGPSLTGVVGRKAGAAPGFEYSAALAASGLVWTREKIDQFIADPAATVPGTAMPVRVPDPAVRAAIVDYLASGH